MITTKIITSDTYENMPWKNGSGITHEILRFPENTENFDFRLSMAEVSQPGDFSFFDGYHRILSILSGEGISLLIENKRTEMLKKQEVFSFSGNVPIYSNLLQGAVTDFNLIYRPEKYRVRCQWIQPQQNSCKILTSAQHTFLFNNSADSCSVIINQKSLELYSSDTLEIYSTQELYEIGLENPKAVIMLELWNK